MLRWWIRGSCTPKCFLLIPLPDWIIRCLFISLTYNPLLHFHTDTFTHSLSLSHTQTHTHTNPLTIFFLLSFANTLSVSLSLDWTRPFYHSLFLSLSRCEVVVIVCRLRHDRGIRVFRLKNPQPFLTWRGSRFFQHRFIGCPFESDFMTSLLRWNKLIEYSRCPLSSHSCFRTSQKRNEWYLLIVKTSRNFMFSFSCCKFWPP